MGAVARHAVEYDWHLNFQMCLTGDLPDEWAGDGIITTLSGDPDRMARFLKAAGRPAVSAEPELSIYRRPTGGP